MEQQNKEQEVLPKRQVEMKFWLALSRAPGIGSVNYNRLLKKFGTPEHLFNASDAALHESDLKAELKEYLKNPDWDSVKADLEWAKQPNNYLITIHNPLYPARLKEIHDPPPILFVTGDPEILNTPQLAMVGSRNPSASGKSNAIDFAHHLASSGITITSGLAIGIDGICHNQALDAGGLTIAVTGTGLDRVYPASQHTLAHRISEHGALVSEFPTGIEARASHFPRRNRIISGLSLGTLVVEAAQKSGSLITARLATEQGRDVFAIPGSIHNPLARGCHNLIRQGAKLVETADDILEEIAPHIRNIEPISDTERVITPGSEDSLDLEYQHLLECMGFDPMHVDLLIERSGLTAEEVSSMLILLELEGHVSSAPGGIYSRTGTNVLNTGQTAPGRDGMTD
jgi:DNA processing protein